MCSFLVYLLCFLIFVKIFSVLVRKRCKSHTCLVGKTVLITGGNRGIGYETALGLAARGCRLIIADKDDCEETKNKIIEETDNTNIVTKRFDLASFDSIRSLAKDINKNESRLDILINNAGTGFGGFVYTKDKIAMTTQINHLGPLLLTYLLIGLMKKTGGRIIFVSSLLAFVNNLTMENLHEMHPLKYAYGNTKLCNIITAKILGEKLQKFGITVNCLHPGFVNTLIFNLADSSTFNRIIQALFNVFVLPAYGRSPEDGAQTTLYLALSNEVVNVSGKFFSECKEDYCVPQKIKDENFCTTIFEKSLELAQLLPNERIIQ